jgi:uncharacterized membrane protein
MSTSIIGLFAGLLLAIAAATGGFGGFLLALVLGAAGFLLGAQRDGDVDLGALVPGRRRG